MWLCGCGEWAGSQVSFCGSQSVFCRRKSKNRIQNLKSKIQVYSRQGGPKHTKGKQKRRRDISVGTWSNTNLSPTLPKCNCETGQKTSGRPGSSRCTWREKRDQVHSWRLSLRLIAQRERERALKKGQRRADIAGTITKSTLLSMGASRRTNGLLRMHLVELPQLVKHPELKSVEWSIPLDSIPLSTTYWRSKPPS